MQYAPTIRRQHGATFLGGLIIAAILGAGLYVVVRLFPLYQEFYEVVSAVEAVAKQNAGGGGSPESIRAELNKKWATAYIDSIHPEDLGITKSGDGLEITIDYRAERPFVGNVSLVVDFYKSVKVQ